MSMNPSLQDFQSDEQCRVLDTVSKVRKCGLDGDLSLPQIVVCGDQSSGKSSVLEALTEIPFPTLTIKIIPDDARSQVEKFKLNRFSQSITNFNELPTMIENAKEVMGIANGGGAFVKDALCIEIQGPDRPHLTLVDIPGLIQSSTRGISKADVAVVSQITTNYIQQHRTICLAVISAANDAANQPILQRVREVDPKGERTLGVITKPDLLSPGSDSEAGFLELALNQNVVFDLGWHVLKNRKFEEKSFSIKERNASETEFFSTSNFQKLPQRSIGAPSLRSKLSHLLYEHVKNELPRLQAELRTKLDTAADDLKDLGEPRSTVMECRSFLGDMSMKFYKLCRAGVNGHYDHDWFKNSDTSIKSAGKVPDERFRAIVQAANKDFANKLREKGHKYHIGDNKSVMLSDSSKRQEQVTKAVALKCVKQALQRSRGTELLGNFNCNVVAELFWEQSEGWDEISNKHIDNVSGNCNRFLQLLLDHVAPANINNRIWSSTVLPALQQHKQDALAELGKLLFDRKSFPINYNHHYTDTIHQKRRERITKQLEKHMPDVYTLRHLDGPKKVIEKALQHWGTSAPVDMEDFSCEEALDCLLAIYKLQQKTFVANVTTQVIERHLVRNLDRIFSPKFALTLTDSQVERMVAEPQATKRARLTLQDKIQRFEEGMAILGEAIDI
ncbi:hypothetical protein Daus18300_004580 [Diaporthe australafricana]|uniref:Interferon-induced GTP-binding protein Mx n=1 Tax=Diaporthe australafricana TaxID=127596 RepID=A0ABR3X7P2_9PEZI